MISIGKGIGKVVSFIGESLKERPMGPIVDAEVAARSINIPAWTKFHPSLSAFEEAGYKIHGDLNDHNLAARIVVEAPKNLTARSGGVVGNFVDESGVISAQYLTTPQYWGCTADLTLFSFQRR